jgi:hypothetical protein
MWHYTHGCRNQGSVLLSRMPVAIGYLNWIYILHACVTYTACLCNTLQWAWLTGKVVPVLIKHHAMMTGVERCRYSSTFLYFVTRWSGQLHAQAALPPGKSHQVPTGYRSLVGPGADIYGMERRKISGDSNSDPFRPADREAVQSPPSNAEVRNCGAVPPVPHMSSWRSA